MRRSLPYMLALGLHGGALAFLISTPPGELLRIRGEVERLDVRFYTVSAPDAESDAQLVEPPLDEDTDLSGDDAPAPVVETAPDEPPAPELEPAPAEPEAAPAPDTDPVTLSEDAFAPPADAETGRASSGDGDSRVSRPTAPAASGAPITTTQQRPNPVRSAPPPPSFADILARAETRLDPDDFRVVLSLGGVRGTVQESFCLSSSAANLDAGDCPDGPNPNSPELAHYGLQGLGEEAPEFLEDLDLMEFQLRQLGANPSQVDRIMLALRESRRDAINTPGVNRAMQRDLDSRTNNLGNLIPDQD